MSTLEITSNERQASYRSWQQERAEAIDEYVDYLRSTSDTWGRIEVIAEWDTVTEKVLEGARSKESADIARYVLETGEWDGLRIDVDDIYRSMSGWNLNWPNNGTDKKNVQEAYTRRLFYAQLALDDLETFNIIQDKDVIGLHGTQAIVLPTIIASNGLLSHARQYEKGIVTGSGEPCTAPIRRGFISFGSIHSATGFSYSDRDIRSENTRKYLADRASVYGGYAQRLDEMNIFEQSVQKRLHSGDAFVALADRDRFGVVFGLARKALWASEDDRKIGRRVHIDSDLDELCFIDKVETEYLPVIFSPQQYTDVMQSVVPETVDVIPKEPIVRAQKKASLSSFNWSTGVQ